tara:strand:- start:8 stop:325 length:318 start_codon:yes stop_codon:yes gene_type:complete
MKKQTLKEYYKHYLTLHKNKNCRRMHVLGQLVTICFIINVACVSYIKGIQYVPLLLLSPFIVYPFAWTGHYLFEKNKPAAFKNPIKAKLCDWIMLYDIIKGKIKL